MILAICWWPWPTHASSLSDFLSTTNAERNKVLVASLKQNPELQSAASAKLADMFANNYWAHVSPTGKQAWDFEKAVGYDYVASAENLSENYITPQAIVDAWMASPEHKKNMLNPLYREVGFAMGSGTINGQAVTLAVAIYGTTVPGETAPLSPHATPHALESHHLPLTTSAPASHHFATKNDNLRDSHPQPATIDVDGITQDVMATDDLNFDGATTDTNGELPGTLAVGILCSYAYLYNWSRRTSVG